MAILDTGISFPLEWQELIVDHWLPDNVHGGNGEHGTKVACNAVFRYIFSQQSSTGLIPRVRVIDCNIIENDTPTDVLIPRIRDAVEKYAGQTKIFNLSANANKPIEGDEMSIVGYELDALQLQKGVQFIVSAGNHGLWENESKLEDILDDDDARIAAPADSLHSIVVGAVVAETHNDSLSSKNHIAPYSRRGPGFVGLSKPDISAYAGTVVKKSGSSFVPPDFASLIMTQNGTLMADAGTSFATPIISGDFAEILDFVPSGDILLAKALLYHHSSPLWDEENITDDSQLFNLHNTYGRGLSDLTSCKYSSPHKVSLVRSGSLNRTSKERVNIYMPQLLAKQKGTNIAKVSITCMSHGSVDKTKGHDYLGAYIQASLKKVESDGIGLLPVSQKFKEGRQKWNICQQFSKIFSRFNSGDWQIWLELFSRWDDQSKDIPYALVVTIEDLSGTLDIYSEIEAQNRYRTMNQLRARVSN